MGRVGLYLCLQDSEYPIRQPFSLSIQAVDGGNRCTRSGYCTFGKMSTVWGFSDFISRADLIYERHELMPNNVLTVTATLMEGGADVKGTKEVAVQTKLQEVSVQTKLQLQRLISANYKFKVDVSIQTDVEHRVADMSVQTEDNAVNLGKVKVEGKLGAEKVLQDIGKLWLSGKNSDVVFKVKNAEFKAHRNILAIRTPVLCAMFQHNTAEKASGEVTIDDCEPAVFEQLLHYIYTGSPGVLNAENAVALYVVADKYLVSEVKDLCLQFMEEELGLETFSDYAELSLTYKGELLEMVVDFFSRNMIHVVKTVEWQRFLSEHSTWGNEIIIRALELTEGRTVENTS